MVWHLQDNQDCPKDDPTRCHPLGVPDCLASAYYLSKHMHSCIRRSTVCNQPWLSLRTSWLPLLTLRNPVNPRLGAAPSMMYAIGIQCVAGMLYAAYVMSLEVCC